MTKEIQIRWVKYPVIIGGEKQFRFGLFNVHFINGDPAYAEIVRIVGFRLALDPDTYPAIVQQFAYASMCETIVCTNSVDLDNVAWDGSLIFDHLPVLS